jgi:hypothetical protein
VMAPAVSSGIEAGRYNYDVSLTQPDGDRFTGSLALRLYLPLIHAEKENERSSNYN